MNNSHLALVMTALTLPPFAHGAEPVTYSFECDTPAGHYSDWTRSVSTTDIRATGKITVNEIRDGGKWMPAAGIMIRGEQDGKEAVAGVSLSGSKQMPDKIFVSIYTPGEADSKNLGTVPATTTEFRFEVTLDDKGLLRVSLGGFAGTRQLEGFKPGKLALNCSTGDFEFSEIGIVESGE